jgi:ABC-type nickel/cobalt efflux system permease component RcnA
VNRYIGVQCDGRGAIHIAYLLDSAELPSYSEFEELDADHDGTVTPDEQRAYLDRRIPPLVAAWTVLVDGERAPARVTGANLEIRDGEQGMSTLRIAADVEAIPASHQGTTPPSPDAREFHVTVRDPTFADRSGWREIAADDSTDTTVAAGYRERPSDALAYSRGASAGPPRVDHADFTFRPVPRSALTPATPTLPSAPVDERLAGLARVMKRASGSWSFSAIALLLAGLLGAAHALSPGHGKALAAAYLVGRRARPSQALILGLSVTAAHTAVVFAFGLFAVAIERITGTERLMRDLELAAAVAVTLLGLAQLSARWQDATTGAASHSSHDHHVPMAVLHGVPHDAPRGTAALVALGASSGLTPCPSAIAILLAAIALHRYAFGLLLVFVFSVGVAFTLTAVGLAVLFARGLVLRAIGPHRLLRWLPVLSSACVTAVGVLLCASAWTSSP